MIPINIVRQNVDINAKPVDLPVMADDQLLITSYFDTIQGEGPHAGRRAFFIRTAGCNFGEKLDSIACNFCDTDFAISKGTITSFQTLLEAVKDSGVRFVVITGGEPLLQPAMPAFIAYLLDNGREVQIETNGSYLFRLNDLATTHAALTIVCSPKQIAGRYASQPPNFAYNQAYNAIHFKFVVTSDSSASHHQIPSAWIGTVRAQWWVSPMTIYRKAYAGEVSSIWDSELIDHAAVAANYRYAATMVMGDARIKFTCQLHTLMAIA